MEEANKADKKFWKEAGHTDPIDYTKIDETLRPLIKLLNEKGFHTMFCCSGDFSDHEGVPHHWNKRGKGYISFDQMSEKREKILAIIAGCAQLAYLPSSEDWARRFCINNLNPPSLFGMMTDTEADNLFSARWEVFEKRLKELDI